MHHRRTEDICGLSVESSKSKCQAVFRQIYLQEWQVKKSQLQVKLLHFAVVKLEAIDVYSDIAM